MADYRQPAPYYHPQYCPHKGKRDLFAEYGTFNAIDTYCKDSQVHIWPQKLHGNTPLQLRASRPSLPFQPPNTLIFPWVDQCAKPLQEFADKKATILKQFESVKGSTYRKPFTVRCSEQDKLSNVLDEISRLKNENVPVTSSPDSDVNSATRNKKTASIQQLCYELALPEWLTKLVFLTKDIEFEDILNANSDYSGGCLKSETLAHSTDDHVLFYPTGKTLEKLQVQLVSFANKQNVRPGNMAVQSSADGCPHPITGISTRTDMCGSVQAAVRRGTHVDVINAHVNNGDVSLKTLHQHDFREKVYSMEFNPYLTDECAITLQNGSIKLWDLERNRPATVLNKHIPRFICKDLWTTCYFGSHPLSLVIADRTGVGLLDLRVNATELLDLFILPSDKLHISERVMVSTSHTEAPSYHMIATDFSLILVDERFANHPVMQWSHSLLSPPQYISPVYNVIGSDTLILLANQSACETVCIQYKLGHGRPPQSTCPMWQISNVRDFTSAPNTVHEFDEQSTVKKRFDVSLLGMCGARHSNDDGFTAYQITAYGDLFYQSYFATTAGTGKTCSMGPGCDNLLLEDNEQTACAKWVKEVCEQADRFPVEFGEGKVQTYDASTPFSEVTCSKRYPHVLCSVCVPSLSKEQDVADSHSDDVCHACNLKLGVSRQITEKSTSNKTINSLYPSTLHQANIFSEDPSAFVSPQCKILYKMWKGVGDTSDLEVDLKKRDDEIVLKKQEAANQRKERIAAKRQVTNETRKTKLSSDLTSCSSSDDVIMSPGFFVSPNRKQRRRKWSGSSVSSVISQSGSLCNSLKLSQLKYSEIKTRFSSTPRNDAKHIAKCPDLVQSPTDFQDSTGFLIPGTSQNFEFGLPKTLSVQSETTRRIHTKKKSFIVGF